jgi:hypothetical protein
VVTKNSCVLIVKTYGDMFLDVYFLCANRSSDTAGTRRGAFWIQAPGGYQMKWAFWCSIPEVSQYPCKANAVNVR